MLSRTLSTALRLVIAGKLRLTMSGTFDLLSYGFLLSLNRFRLIMIM
jgi:hypothetical protein